MMVFANRDIKKNEEILIDYVSGLKGGERANALRRCGIKEW